MDLIFTGFKIRQGRLEGGAKGRVDLGQIKGLVDSVFSQA